MTKGKNYSSRRELKEHLAYGEELKREFREQVVKILSDQNMMVACPKCESTKNHDLGDCIGQKDFWELRWKCRCGHYFDTLLSKDHIC